MGNRTTTQKAPQHLSTSTYFQRLKDLPTSLSNSQCVLHKHEIIICGGYGQRACYSYHTIKDEYKFICEYPSDVQLWGHSIVKLVDNNNNNKRNNEIILLVWSKISNKSKNYNKWIPFTDNHNNPIIIGRYKDNSYVGMRALISGSNNHLLFITYYPNNISVFDLNTFRFIKHDILLTDNNIFFHCFVLNSKNGQGQEMMKTNQKYKQNYQMLLFCLKTRLSIEYDEDDNTFQFYQLSVCKDMRHSLNMHMCVLMMLSLHKYLIQENKWTTFENTLPSSLHHCVAILSEDNDYIHIIGGKYDTYRAVSTHIKTKVCACDVSQLVNIIHYWTRTLKIKFG
ncbi:hypothetical protein RFI_13626 [Reticulomyxa filosa]|uniref:Uncharacterized protein n=1 Tax=Reticulomyxa filosa TaxID=46433 RepID=X6NB92_RETFI|nr:hypothetical protein RFI_13626 [Reticulomyxa filosa]|eukprot:ETO23555.1 hypothetical protein RFI_13626 [Reticulomyxa filosa]